MSELTPEQKRILALRQPASDYISVLKHVRDFNVIFDNMIVPFVYFGHIVTATDEEVEQYVASISDGIRNGIREVRAVSPRPPAWPGARADDKAT